MYPGHYQVMPWWTDIGTYDDKHSFLGFQRISVLKGVGHQDSGPGRPGPARGFTHGNRLSGSETWSGKPEPGITHKHHLIWPRHVHAHFCDTFPLLYISHLQEVMPTTRKKCRPLKSAIARTRICLLWPQICYIRTRIGPFSRAKIRYFPDRHMGSFWGLARLTSSWGSVRVVAGLLKEPLDEHECGSAVINLAYLCHDWHSVKTRIQVKVSLSQVLVGILVF